MYSMPQQAVTNGKTKREVVVFCFNLLEIAQIIRTSFQLLSCRSLPNGETTMYYAGSIECLLPIHSIPIIAAIFALIIPFYTFYHLYRIKPLPPEMGVFSFPFPFPLLHMTLFRALPHTNTHPLPPPSHFSACQKAKRVRNALPSSLSL